MGKLTLSNLAFWFLAAVSAAMLCALVLVLGGVVPIESPSEPAETQAEAVAAAAPPPPTTASRKQVTTTRTAVPAKTTAAAETEPDPTPAPVEPAPATLVVVTAARGDSWFSARLGSETGRVLDERVLAQGESARFEGKRIWLIVGAAGNVDLTVDGKPRALAPGTVSVVLTPSSTPATSS